MWSALVGGAAPLLVAVVQQPSWGRPLRAVVTLMLCLLLGSGTAFFNDQFNGRGIASCVLLVLFAAWTSYLALWKPTRVAPAIETATSPATTTTPTAGEVTP